MIKIIYYVYMLRCNDNSIYTGITNDIVRRVQEHLGKEKVAAKYTKSHPVLRVERVWQTCEKVAACKAEYYIKKLTKGKKEELIMSPERLCAFCKQLQGFEFETYKGNLEFCIKKES